MQPGDDGGVLEDGGGAAEGVRDGSSTVEGLKELYRQEVAGYVATLTNDYGLSPKQAEKMFLFGITGAFEVNKSMNWEKNEDWYKVQKVLMTFLAGGYEALKKMKEEKE